jgi:hypothetical protein
MLNRDILHTLHSDEGKALLAEARSLSGELLARLTTLRKGWSPELASAAVELLHLRDRAKVKFTLAEQMFFTAQGLEQSSGEAISRWRAARFPQDATILDLCCGIGGDALALGERGPVLAVDMDPTTAFCAASNAKLYGVGENVSVICADATRITLKADAAFFDPSRRREGRRMRSGEDYSPPLSFIHEIRNQIPNLAVKVSPALEEAALEMAGGRIEFVSDKGECKEAIIWSGEIGPTAARSATLLPANISLIQNQDAPPLIVGEPLGWLYEPDAAVVRSHLIAEVAALVKGQQLDSQIAYLTSGEYASSPFTTVYRIIEWHPFNLKKLQARLKQLGLKVAAIKRRGVPLEPEALSKQLTGAGETPCVVVLTRVNGSPAAILCEPPSHC